MTAPAPAPRPTSPNELDTEVGEAPKSDSAPGNHLESHEIYQLIEKKLSRRKLRAAEAHLDGCSDCVETLAMVLRAGRPASREEQQILAETQEPSVSDLVDALRPKMGSGPSRREWRVVVAAFVVAAVLFALGMFLRDRFWLPAASRRAAEETLVALVQLRQATGRIPLRYITEFERAGVVRSSFDDTDAAEQLLLFNLRTAVERAPEPEAVLMLGLLLLDEGELEEAEQLLTQVTEERPDSADAYNGLAVVYYERAQQETEQSYALLQRGLAHLRRAEQLAPDDPRILYNFGKFYEALEMYAAARKAWTRYLNKDPTSQWAEEAAFALAR